MAMRPERYRDAVVPHIYIDGADAAVRFYKDAFGAEELFRIAGPDGRIIHAELSFCGATIMLGDPDDRLYAEPRRVGRCTAGLHLFVDDNAATVRRAVKAGCEEIQAPTDMFYGASSASVRDPFGHVWVLLTWKDDLSPSEMERRGKEELDPAFKGSRCASEFSRSMYGTARAIKDARRSSTARSPRSNPISSRSRR